MSDTIQEFLSKQAPTSTRNVALVQIFGSLCDRAAVAGFCESPSRGIRVIPAER
jgi:hypothetical protein